MTKQETIKLDGIKESSNYVFHYTLGSVANKEIDNIIKEQELSYEKITSFFDVKPPFKINYYLLSTSKEVGILYGDNEPCNGFASEPNNIYAVYNKDIKCIGPHEDGHIISYLVGLPKSVFIREGIAMYFDETWCGKSNEYWVKKFIDNNQYVPIDTLLNDDTFYSISCEITYPIAGAFTKFIISVLGKEKYLNLYKKDSFNVEYLCSLLKCYNIDDVFKEWIKNN